MDYVVLHDEIMNDPAGLGYAGKTDQEVADLLNAVNQEVERETVETWEVIEATVPADWLALSEAEKERYRDFISAGTLNVKGENTRAAFAAMFGAGTQTRANLIALQTELQSRAQVLGLGRVKQGHVAKARALGGE